MPMRNHPTPSGRETVDRLEYALAQLGWTYKMGWVSRGRERQGVLFMLDSRGRTCGEVDFVRAGEDEKLGTVRTGSAKHRAVLRVLRMVEPTLADRLERGRSALAKGMTAAQYAEYLCLEPDSVLMPTEAS
jgi:hypothetical protein